MEAKIFISLILFLFLLGTVSATHFRFGTISWRVPNPSKPHSIEFYSSFTFRRSFFGKPNVGSVINPGTFTFGDGSAYTQLYLTISAINLDADWCSGTFTTSYDYPEGINATYTAMHTSAGRILELNNNPNKNWNVTSTVSVGAKAIVNGANVPNTAPVSNNLPIVYAWSSYVNKFTVTASDAENQVITYSVATARDMGATSLTLAPNLSVNSTSGEVTFNTVGVKDGFWCTQIKFSDGVCYSVVDFLIYVSPRPMICHSSCTNSGSSCTASGDCSGCTVAAAGRCINADPPYLVIPPTPTDGQSFVVDVGSPVTVQWSAYSPLAPVVTVTSSSLPAAGVLTSTASNGKFHNQTFTWTPTLADVGVYVITLGCFDSQGQSCIGQKSFSINVLKPYCGRGATANNCDPKTTSGCTCVCNPTGYDAASNCYECKSGFYGSDCLPCPSCVYGVCNDGTSGTGSCICYSGWQGANCSYPLNKPCNSAAPHSIVSNVSTGQYVNPSTYYTYVSNNSALTPLSVSFTTAMPAVPAKLDVLLIVDVTKSITSSMLSFFQEVYAKTFFDSVRKLVPNSYFGVSTFTDRPNGGNGCTTSDYPFRLHLPLSTDYSDFISALNSYMKATTLGCNDATSKNDAQLDALVLASQASTGWRSDAYKVAILITDSTFWDSGIYNTQADAKSALIAANIVPIFLTTTTPASVYTSLVSTFAFGIATTVQSDYSNVFAQAYAQIPNALKLVSLQISQDTYKMIRSGATTKQSTVSSLPTSVTNTITMGYSTTQVLDTIDNYPEIGITIMGYGTSTIVAQVNRAPVPVVCSATTREDIPVEVSISGTDSDGNALTVTLSKLPSNGYLAVNKSTSVKVVTGTAYNIPDGGAVSFFNYVPKLNYYGTDSFQYSVSDGCLVSATVTCSLTINFYNYPPVAISTYTSILENVVSIIKLNGSDVETIFSNLVFFVTTLPDPNLGVLKRVSTGNLVVVNERFNVGENTVQFVPVQYACCDIASFTFQVQDAESQTSASLATASVEIIGVNQAPTASASDVTVDRGTQTAIVLSAWDPDRNDQETFIITSASSGFTTSANISIPSGTNIRSIVGANITVNSAGNAATTIYYNAPANQVGSKFANITFNVTDLSGAPSDPKTVFVSVNTVNRLPTANPAGPITLFQDSSSPIWNLNGTDADPADATTLKVQITSLPTKGTLTQSTVGDIATSATLPFTLSNRGDIFYSTNSTGPDSFTFRVMDLMGGVSSQQVVSIVVTPVNHAPTASFPAVTTPEDIPVIIQISPYDQDGNTVSVIITTVTRGNIWQFDGTPITVFPANITDGQYRFKFQGLKDEFGSPYCNISFYVNDNQGKPNSNSSLVTGSITVTPVNDAPVAIPISITILENSGPVNITLNATDIETPLNVSAFLISKPLSTLGTIKRVTGETLDVRSIVTDPRVVTFYPNQYQYGTTTFTFGANDGELDSDSAAIGTITVTHVNHPPTATATTPVTATRSVPLTISLVVRDFDIGDNLTVTIKGFTGRGVLSYNGVTISSSSYVLPAVTIPSTNSRTITLTYVAPANAAAGAGFASFSFDVMDQGFLNATTTNVSISIANNNVPVANPAGPLRVTQDIISGALLLNGTDADVADANSLSVVILTVPSKGKLFDNTNTVITAGSYLPQGVSSVTYLTTQRGADSFTFGVTDLVGATSAAVTVIINITNTNHPPSIFWVGTAVANEDTLLDITNIQATDPDDGDKVYVTVVAGPAKGSLTQFVTPYVQPYVSCVAPCNITDAAYRLKFMPLPDDNSVNNQPYASISVVASDGMNQSSVVTGSLYITPVNDAPVAYSSVVPTNENVRVNISLNATDIDTDMSKVSAVIQTLPNSAIGTITTIGGAALKIGSAIILGATGNPHLTFVPTQWASGSTSFSFLANDGELNSQTVTVTVNVAPVRQDPICSSETRLVQRDSTTTLKLSAFDPDQGETYTYIMTSYTQVNGTLTSGSTTIDGSTSTIGSGTTVNYYVELDLVYTVPNTVAFAYLILGYKVSDGTGSSAECFLRVNSSINQPPTANPVPLVKVDEDGTSSVFVLNGTDPDDNALLYVVITDLPQHGILYQNQPQKAITSRSTLDYGSFAVYYVPNKLYDGKDNFTFLVRDIVGSVSDKKFVDITINHVNHAPVIVGGSNVSTLEDTPIFITQVLASDADGDRVYVYIKNAPAHGKFQQWDNTDILSTSYPDVQLTSTTYDFYFVPAHNENGENYANFTVYGEDPSGNKSTEATVFITVIPVDDPPVAVDVPFSATEKTTVTATNITLAATDDDTPQVNISATVLSLPSASIGTLQSVDGTVLKVGDIVPSRVVTFVTAAGYIYGDTSFTFNVKDQTSYSANTATVSISIQHVNHNPTANDGTVAATRSVPTTIVLSGTDPDTIDVFHFVVDSITTGAGGVFAVNGNPITTPDTNISTGVVNTPSRTFSTSITFTAPVTATGTAFANFTYHIEDQAGGKSANMTIVIDIAPNSAPIAIPASFDAYQDTPSPYVVLYGTDADPADANNLLLVITSLPQLGVLIVNSTFNITSPNTVLPSGTSVSYYTTSRGSDSFTYYVEDNLGTHSGTAMAEVTIHNVNHPPTAVYHGPATGLEDTNITINQIALADPDGDTVRVYVTSVPESGTLTQFDGTPITTASPSSPVLVTESHGWLIYVPAPDQFGDPIANFSFYADDGQANNSRTEIITATITVTPVNDAPIAISNTTSALENDPDILITLAVFDVDTPLANISVYLTTLPARTIGVLVDVTTKNPIQLLAKIPSRQVLLQLVPYAHGDTSFSFFANDGLVDSSSGAVQTISIANVNQAPTASAASPINAPRGVPTAITLQVFDQDLPEQFNIYVISYTALGGYFTFNHTHLQNYSATTPFLLESNVSKLDLGNSFVFHFVAPANMFGDNFASLSLQAFDAANASSPVITVSVNALKGTQPTANPAGPITFDEETQSISFSLNGTDVDHADANDLSVVITSLPTKATIYVQSTDGTPDRAINTTGVILTNPMVYLIGKSLSYGQDSFAFEVVDLVNQSSTPATVSLQINHVNHPPVAGAIITTGYMNSNLEFKVFGQDPDNDLPLTVFVTTVPSVGSLFQADGTLIPKNTSVANPTKVTDYNGKLIYQAPTNQWGLPIANISLIVDDNTETSNSQSAIYTTGLYLERVDLAPTVTNLTLNMLQNTALNFSVPVTDVQNYRSFVTIITFPLYGNLYRGDGSEISPTSPVTNDTVTYVPPPKGYDNGVAAYATLTYRATAISNTTLSSNVGTATIFVKQTFGPPVFTGATQYDIPENANLTMLLTGSSEVNNYGIKIISIVAADRGFIFTRTCTGDEGCMTMNMTEGSDLVSTDMEYRLRYTPPTDRYGTAFANFTIIVTDPYGQSDPVTITINIYHINVPPVIVPWTYDTVNEDGVSTTYNWSNAIVNIVEGNDAVIAWKLQDKDTPQVNLTSIVYALPYRGQLFYPTKVEGGYVAGESLSKSGSVVIANEDGLFRLVFRPEAGKSGTNYATFSLIGFDQIDQSSRISLKINVRHVNLAPWIQIQEPNWNTTEAVPIIITGVSMNDTDASFYSEMFRLSLSYADNQPAPAGSVLDLTFFNNASCSHESDTVLSCKSTLTNLNQLLTQISVQVPTTGSFMITVFIDDLGANSANRSTNHLNATDYVYITAFAAGGDGGSGGGSNSGVMTAVVASAAGVGAAAAAGKLFFLIKAKVWRYMKKKSPPTIDFFGMDGVDTHVTNNPLFEESESMSFSNVLYEGSS